MIICFLFQECFFSFTLEEYVLLHVLYRKVVRAIIRHCTLYETVCSFIIYN